MSDSNILIDEWHDGRNWYRIWKNKWCEQGGWVRDAGVNYRQYIRFHKPFTDTNYTILSAAETKDFGGAGNCGYWIPLSGTLTTEGFEMQVCQYHFTAYFWEAKGFVK